MKKIITTLFVFLTLISITGAVAINASADTDFNADLNLAKNCKAAYLADWYSGTKIYSKNETQHLPIASMCKIMTLILCMDEIENGSLRLDDDITVSKNASGMGGSQVFLELGAVYKASDLIKSICIASANDACVAMAERIAGSEELFVNKMNERAQNLGANDTVFVNCTGLPKQGHYSCAKDVALMLCELINHKDYFKFSKIWTDKIRHPKNRETEMANTNKLVKFYNGCDAGKTGFTNEAGFCLAASAKRGNMRVVSVVIGASDSKSRFGAVSTMFDYAFATCENKIVVDSERILDEKCQVNGGKQDDVAVKPERNSYVFVNKSENREIVADVNFKQVKAPVKVGDCVGEITVYKNGIEVDKIKLLANEDVDKNSLWDAIGDIAENWNF